MNIIMRYLDGRLVEHRINGVVQNGLAGDGLPAIPRKSKTHTAKSIVQYGAGTELKKLLSKLGLEPAANCKCTQHISEMNQKGIEWCSQNIDTIVGWLKEEAERVKRDKQEAIGKLERINSSQERLQEAAMRQLEMRAKARSVPFTAIGAKILVKRAISNARKKEIRSGSKKKLLPSKNDSERHTI